jgi:hypothetical protein
MLQTSSVGGQQAAQGLAQLLGVGRGGGAPVAAAVHAAGQAGRLARRRRQRIDAVDAQRR